MSINVISEKIRSLLVPLSVSLCSTHGGKKEGNWGIKMVLETLTRCLQGYVKKKLFHCDIINDSSLISVNTSMKALFEWEGRV